MNKTPYFLSVRRKVLIVGGQFERFADLVRTFDRNDFEVLFANSGSEGLRAARVERPNLILCDLGLPEFSAIEFCREIRNDILTSSSAFIMLSRRYHNRQNITEALAAGADDCLPHEAEVEFLFAKSLWQLHRLVSEAENREANEAFVRRSQVLSEIVEHLAEQTAGYPGLSEANPLLHDVLESIAALLSESRGIARPSKKAFEPSPLPQTYDHSVIEFAM
ncbi:MAG: response regulator [Acidobacteria bacterium]|nr:response regulator [Acidobacteriota bacterium]